MENKGRVAFYNLGCKVNDFDTESMGALFLKSGYQIVDFDSTADVYVVNTCTVTHLGDRKSRQILRRARRKNPDAVIVAAGCYAQVAPDEVAAIDEVDIILGTTHRHKIVEEVENFLKDHQREMCVENVWDSKTFEDMPIAEQRHHTRAFIKVQDGCNQFCSYCIIPYARGRVRSRSIASVCQEVEKLVADGYQEFVFSGIHIASYGKEFDGSVNLLTLLQFVAKIPGVKRIRLGSIEPLLMTEKFVQKLSKIPQICPQFHLSLQSGCDTTLKRMNRKYTTAQFIQIVQYIRQYFTLPALTTDIIVGFPGETEDEFEQTIQFVQTINFYKIHVFKYSRRKGTPAYDFPDQIDPSIQHQRSQRLIALSKKQEEAFLRENDQRVQPVLFEQIHEDGTMTGHTPNYIPVEMKAVPDSLGKIKEIVLHYQQGSANMIGTEINN